MGLLLWQDKMNKKSGYPLIDYYRIIAAIFVIVIHTVPLESVLLKIIVRTAVPFFFITTGYFYFLNHKLLHQVIKNIAIIYGIAILLYLPVNIYNYDSFKLFDFFKALFIDGTFYHLWYLPATITGLVIVNKLVKHCSIKHSFIIVLILYLIGLGGDSYYELVINHLSSFYQLIFTFGDYTRNGIFFAPLFIYLGYLLAVYPIKIKKLGLKIIISFIIMFLEVIVINYYSLSNHDAMTLMLPVFMFYSYQLLLKYPGKRLWFCKDLSLWIYLLHPLIIILVRVVSKFSSSILVENLAVHFMMVTGLSFFAAVIVIRVRRYLCG